MGYSFYPVMAAIAEGTDAVVKAAAEKLASLPPVKIYEPEPEVVEFKLENSREFTIRKEDGVYFIDAPWLLKIMNNTNPDDYESMQYFQRVLRESGIIDELEKQGITDGDTVSVYDIEFDYVS